jgi:tRNA(Arg) A34 adenosine deaminase TadA
VGDASALKLAAVGWTIALLAMSWAIVERRGRVRAELEKDQRQRDSDAAHHARVARLREASTEMRKALDSIDLNSTHDESR